MMFGFSFWDEYIYLDEGMMTKPVVTSLERWDGAGDIILDEGR